MEDDLRKSLDRLFNRNHIDTDSERFELALAAVRSLFDDLPKERQDSLRLFLMREGIKRIAGI